MAQQPIELILSRQLADHIAIPIWITDAAGDLVFYNEPAEPILGMRFDEAGPISAAQLAELFVTTGLDGNPMPTEELPIVIALTEQRPAHASIRIRAQDGHWRVIEVTAVPIEGQGGRFQGAMAWFWEIDA